MTDDSLTWETTDSEIDYTCPGFEVRRDDVRLPDGTETDYHYVDEQPAVVVLPFTTDGEVVVIEEWRQAVGRVNRGIPAGTVEPANGFADAVFHYYLAEGCTPTAERNLDYNESIEVSTTTVAELVEAVASDDLRDGRTALAVLYYETFGN